ncbi:MAG: hypothetical protein AABX99_02740 [Nanoarchaeota archaeon]
MTDIIEYEKQIWTIFSTGVLISLAIIYLSYGEPFLYNFTFKILSLYFGFICLIYSVLAILGCGTKKRIQITLMEKIDEVKMKKQLDKTFFSRTAWMGEIILFLIIAFYSYFFFNIGIVYFLLSLIIIIFFVLGVLFNNMKILFKNSK